MYRESYQGGCLSIFYGGGSNPLNLWETHIKDGNIHRFLDPELKALVVDIRGTNVSTTYMVCPKGKRTLGVVMPFLVMIVKNLHKYFAFEVTIVDDSGAKRRFRVANFQSCTQILPLSTVMPICLEDGWNQIHFNLAEFTQRAYSRLFMEVVRVKINANIRLRRIYFADKIFRDDELPAEFKLFYPLKKRESKRQSKEAEVKAPEQSEPIEKVPFEEAVQAPMKPDYPKRRQSSFDTKKIQSTENIASVRDMTVIKASHLCINVNSTELETGPQPEPSPLKIPSRGSIPSRAGGLIKSQIIDEDADLNEIVNLNEEVVDLNEELADLNEEVADVNEEVADVNEGEVTKDIEELGREEGEVILEETPEF